MRLVLVALALLAPAAPAAVAVEPLRGEAAEHFLRKAEVVHLATLDTGVTRSQRALLRDGDREAYAVWKVINEYAPVKDFRDGGLPEVGFRDSYKSEIAAYELAKLLGLELVPATVERRIRRSRGSLQLWVEGAVTAAEWHRDAERRAKTTRAQVEQMHTVRLLRQLTHDSDFTNASNVLVDAADRMWAIDFSRAFRTHAVILAESDLKLFSRSLLERLRALDEATLTEHLGKWLSKSQRASLLARRDLILELADRRVRESGADAVLFD